MEAQGSKTMSPKKENPNISPETLALYETLIAQFPGLERKGAGTPYTSLNTYMTSFLGADGGMALRLPAAARQEFLTKYQTTLYVAYGIVQKEFVAVPSELLSRTQELKPYFAISLEYVKTLKPNPRKKTAASGE
jgi:hypothetical protein